MPNLKRREKKKAKRKSKLTRKKHTSIPVAPPMRYRPVIIGLDDACAKYFGESHHEKEVLIEPPARELPEDTRIRQMQ